MIIRCLPPSSSSSFIITNPSFRPNLLAARPPCLSLSFLIFIQYLLLTPFACCCWVSPLGKSRNNHLKLRSLRVDDYVLPAKEDDHGGVTVEMSTHPIDPIHFTSLLKASLLQWKQQGKKGVWIKLPIELVNLIEPAVKEGFYYHHAEPDYLMLVHWIPVTNNTLPPNASHRVGVGAFVMKEDGQVLVVQEKGGKLRGKGIWKFPTGVVEEGEDICDAAVREVKEETGIDAKFVEILAFRQSHKKFFEKSDLFFMCMLEPVSFDIQKQDREIEAAQWMPFEEYVAQDFVQKHDLPRYIAEICLAKRDKRYAGFSPVSTVSSFSKSQCNLYLNAAGLSSS